jgi:uncharacterized protein (TIGR02284 family)
MKNDKELCDALNNILQFLQDSAECFSKHVENVKTSELKALFKDFTLSREDMIREIEEELILRGDHRKIKGTLLGKAHMLFENLKSYISKGDPLIITKEVRRGEGVLIEYYKEALALQIPPVLRAKLMKHLNKIENDVKESDMLSVQNLEA